MRANDLEVMQASWHPFVSWRAVIAGLFVTILTFSILSFLGMAVGGIALNNVVEDGGAQGLSIGAGVWFLVTVLVSLFVGSYFSGRVSSFFTARVGAAQGLVIAALFSVLFLYQVGLTLGAVTGGVANAVSGIGGAAASQAGNVNRLIQTPQIQQLIDRATANLNLRSEPEVVAQGVATRLIRGDEESAKNYLAYQAGITPEEADQRLAGIREDFTAAVQSAGQTAANVIQTIGWTMFAMLLLGTIVACWGGAIGARATMRKPLVDSDRVHIGAGVPAGV